jgi:hypothetical protein
MMAFDEAVAPVPISFAEIKPTGLAGQPAVAAGLTVTFGNPRRIRDILPDHEFRGAGGRGSGVYTARYGDRYCLLCRSGTDPVTGGPR